MQRCRQFARRTRECAEYQDAALVVACAHKFFRDQVHAVVKTTDVAHVAGSQELEYVRWFVVLFKENDGTVVTRSEATVDSIDGCDDLGSALSIGGKTRSAGFGNLQQDDAFPQFRL